jgi:Zinc finger, C3HC4 type (RING finger)
MQMRLSSNYFKKLKSKREIIPLGKEKPSFRNQSHKFSVDQIKSSLDLSMPSEFSPDIKKVAKNFSSLRAIEESLDSKSIIPSFSFREILKNHQNDEEEFQMEALQSDSENQQKQKSENEGNGKQAESDSANNQEWNKTDRSPKVLECPEHLGELKRQNSYEDSSCLCTICFDNKPDAVYGCGHGGLCYTCSVDIWRKGKACPLCRMVWPLSILPLISIVPKTAD